MEDVRNVEPKSLFNHFADICEIPHGSYNTQQISDFLVEFAKAQGLRYVQDDCTNVIIYKDATPGYEDAPVVMLQGHIDMVCEKEDGCSKDLAKDGLDLLIDGDWLTADGTTLGGDDGFAVAAMMALLEADDIPHPGLECIFTADEETGLEGAEGLDTSLLSGKMMINLDSEDEGILTVSCAGGITATATIPVTTEPAQGRPYRITIDQLIGGHSGTEINKEHANANVLMGRVLYQLRKTTPLQIASIGGGSADNVICKRCDAVVFTEAEDLPERLAEIQAVISHEYQSSDPDIRLSVALATDEAGAGATSDGAAEKVCDGAEMLDEASTSRVLAYLLMAPNGVQNVSVDIPDLVETSLNLGALSLENKTLTALYAVRSSVKTRQDFTCDKLDAVAAALGGKVDYQFYYPAWEYLADSPLREVCLDIFRQQYGRDMTVEAIHAGLECGIFAGKMGEGFDAVSIGPDMRDVHTPDEKLSISSTQRFWKYLLGVLAALK